MLATDMNAMALASLAQVETRVLDVTDAAAISALFAERPAFDVVFNCAGYVAHGSILDCGEEAWVRSFDLNVTSMFRICKAALPAMLARGSGSIVNVASVASSVKGVPERFAYGASKAAVIGLTRSIAADFVAAGVRCNAIAPGTIATPSLRAAHGGAARGPGRGRASLHRPPADGPPGDGRRSGGAGGLSGLGRERLHDRPGARAGWRVDRMNPILVEFTRGDLVESRHRGAIAIADASGRLAWSCGDVERPIYPRSAVKMLQALSLVESGAADAFGLGDAGARARLRLAQRRAVPRRGRARLARTASAWTRMRWPAARQRRTRWRGH